MGCVFKWCLRSINDTKEIENCFGEPLSRNLCTSDRMITERQFKSKIVFETFVSWEGKKMSNAWLMIQLAFHQVLQLIGFGFHAGISQ